MVDFHITSAEPLSSTVKKVSFKLMLYSMISLFKKGKSVSLCIKCLGNEYCFGQELSNNVTKNIITRIRKFCCNSEWLIYNFVL